MIKGYGVFYTKLRYLWNGGYRELYQGNTKVFMT